jgi:hypothetical protein
VVYILAATTAADLAKLESHALPSAHGPLAFTPEVTVPMFLDRFDKYAFNFYYGPWTEPKGIKPFTYDYLKDFDWAAQQDHAGITMDAGVDRVTTAEGMTDAPNWMFALQAARERGMPAAIQTDFEDEAPDWLLNRYRDEVSMEMPGYVGGRREPGICDPEAGELSWTSTKGENALLATMQQNVRDVTTFPNLTHLMEPHGETSSNCPDVMQEYGPVADASYRAYLQKEYPTLPDLNTAWGTAFSSWDEVRVPELVTFAGYGPNAVDLGGTWRIAYEPSTDGQAHDVNQLRDLAQQRKLTQKPAPEEWFGEKFDDSAWPTLTVPGDDLQALLPRAAAVFRRSFDVPAGWTAQAPQTWLYIWDLSHVPDRGDMLRADLNGKTVGKSGTAHWPVHWCVFDVTAAVRDGANELAVRVPEGHINYKVYLSHDAPKAYPDLGPQKNAQWSDFIDWSQDMRIDAMRRGMEMVRQVDSDRGLIMMSPGEHAAGMKDLARAYGGDFHDTGGMGGWWNDILPALMRGAGLPMSTEPGNGPANPADFADWLGNWTTEGINALDFFQTMGEVVWNPANKKYFEDNLKVIKFMGKYHVPFAEVAALYSSRELGLMGYPWDVTGEGDGFGWMASRDFLGSGYVSLMEPRTTFRDRYESDAVTESSFSNGDAARYKVIVDSDTSVMDAKTVAAIEKYVRAGGVFVTYGETARHTPVQKDAWSLEHLTGYHVVEPRMRQNGMPQLAPGQPVLSGDLPANLKPNRGGMRMQKIAPDAIDLLHWNDGSVAAGMRPLGRGYIVQWGYWSDRPFTGKCLGQIMAWRGVASIPAQVEPANAKMQFRHFITNNGLYDVWCVWNGDKAQPFNGQVVLDPSLNPAWAIVVKDGSRIPVVNHSIPFSLAPLELVFYLTPRQDLAHASTEWLTLQRGWWQGTTPPASPALPAPPHRFSMNLSDNWSFQEMSPTDQGPALAAPGLDDSKWPKVNLGIWNLQGHPTITHAMLRRHLTIPSDWTDGDLGLWLCTSGGIAFRTLGTPYLDGKPIFDGPKSDGFSEINPQGILKPGTDHVLALDINEGVCKLGGTVTGAWLWRWPQPSNTLDLAGTWAASVDGLTFNTQATLPGTINGRAFRWSGTIPASESGFIVNGRLVAPRGAVRWTIHHFQLDVTPWIRFGQTNQIVLTNERTEPTKVEKINLSFFPAGTYP